MFGSVAAATVSVVSSTQLTVVAPPSATAAAVSISVATPSGSATSSETFTYFIANVPAWATLLEAAPDPAVVTSATLRDAILATGHAWRVRDNGTGIEMVLVPPGTFDMGCSASYDWVCASDGRDTPLHTVMLTNAFYLGRYEVTQIEWQATMGSNPSYFQPPNTADQLGIRPVEQVSWNTIQGFLTATGMRLPTEAEWEYAYRAGTTTAFHGFTGYLNGTNDDSLVGNIAWCGWNNGASGTFNYGTKGAGWKAANGLGLHDMAGNVWEWVNDWYSGTYYLSSPSTDPPGPASGTFRVLRGGSWNITDVRSSVRDYNAPYNRGGTIGFRVARNP